MFNSLSLQITGITSTGKRVWGKNSKMIDMLKVAEAKVVDVMVKKVTKGPKQSKIPTKATKRTKEPTVSKKSNKKRNPQYNQN